ncbi:hypothetical protein AR457_28170 [Streptomyces agglomeratus]|uniref:DUF1918 domain-containing protein n=1 Tax=Streptomyces agglomeratus TaxID=285458 RepID=A0A1E5PE23_9ACTN|nr:DUF1918 domain-containing protein [Streptomyces agglomeratus]OEJ27766.1 hypothetical protein AS594_28050 [Streptomyces agglomeratus]OEJ38174.1 hypothetical protein BGK70_08485 [Streptomyces agglomeratus]OEJ47442.1 hypothetical protein AR457_28170 [Streptomyces agglomeratus]OEJ50701.1 hypothetical protein BGK72_07960 [Streptomyces agglomeratus]OEJ58063.1 hypothetical protein BGM19_08830 [Streptomyces agglomeratus]
MQASVGDQLLVHGRTVGHEDKVAKIVEVLGSEGTPPYRVRFDDGHEALVSPGPDSVVRHKEHGGTPQ